MAKYSKGDWCYDNEMSGGNYFWKLGGVSSMDGRTAYDVAFMMDTGKSLVFRHWGDLSSVLESDLRPVISVSDLLRCKLSDAKKVYLDARQKAEDLLKDVDALLRAQELMRKS